MNIFLKYIAGVFICVSYCSGAVKAMDMPDYDLPGSPEGLEPPMDYPGMHGLGDPLGRGRDREPHPSEMRRNEAIVGDKRFKLYEKKQLSFKKAKQFCLDKGGHLVSLKSIGMESMHLAKGLEKIFKRVMEIKKDVWTEIDVKDWQEVMKKMGKKEEETKNLEKEMEGKCPALSIGRAGLAPVDCGESLPFICQYKRYRPRTTKKPKGEKQAAKDEMK